MTRSTSGHTGRRWLAILAALTCALGVSGGLQAVAQAATTPTNGPETRPFEPGEEGMVGEEAHSRSNSPSRVPAAMVPRPTPLAVAANGAAKAFEGLTMKDQRDSNGGNSFSLEPPDQGLCVSGSQVLEGVNDVFTIHPKSGGQRAEPMSYDVFFNGVAEIDRTPDPGQTDIFGPFVSDPKCYWDPALQRFYMTILELGTDPTTGDFNGESFIDIAVSRSATPTTAAADWFLYQLDVANDGGPDTTTGVSGRTRNSSTSSPKRIASGSSRVTANCAAPTSHG